MSAASRTGADLRGLYESLGLTQSDVCRLLGIRNVESLRRQCRGVSHIQPSTWATLDDLARRRDRMVDDILRRTEGMRTVTLPIYAGIHWETHFRNRVSTLAAWVLEGDGVAVRYELKDGD